MPSGSSVLTFKNNFNLEYNTSNTNDGYDGGVLEIKIGNGAFTDIITAGGSFVTGGYDAVIDTAWQNPLAGRPAWSGNSRGFITTTVNLPSSAASTNIQLRWNCGSDNGNVFVGWWIDTITISNLVCTTFRPAVAQSIFTSNDRRIQHADCHKYGDRRWQPAANVYLSIGFAAKRRRYQHQRHHCVVASPDAKPEHQYHHHGSDG